MLKIRIEGLPAEVETAVSDLMESFRVLSASDPYPNRRGSLYVRRYVDAELLPKETPSPDKR